MEDVFTVAPPINIDPITEEIKAIQTQIADYENMIAANDAIMLKRKKALLMAILLDD